MSFDIGGANSQFRSFRKLPRWRFIVWRTNSWPWEDSSISRQILETKIMNRLHMELLMYHVRGWTSPTTTHISWHASTCCMYKWVHKQTSTTRKIPSLVRRYDYLWKTLSGHISSNLLLINHFRRAVKSTPVVPSSRPTNLSWCMPCAPSLDLVLYRCMSALLWIMQIVNLLDAPTNLDDWEI